MKTWVVGDCWVRLNQNIIKNCFNTVYFISFCFFTLWHFIHDKFHSVRSIHALLSSSCIDFARVLCRMLRIRCAEPLNARCHKDNKYGKGEIHYIVSLSEYIEAMLYHILVMANTAVSYHP